MLNELEGGRREEGAASNVSNRGLSPPLSSLPPSLLARHSLLAALFPDRDHKMGNPNLKCDSMMVGPLPTQRITILFIKTIGGRVHATFPVSYVDSWRVVLARPALPAPPSCLPRRKSAAKAAAVGGGAAAAASGRRVGRSTAIHRPLGAHKAVAAAVTDDRGLRLLLPLLLLSGSLVRPSCLSFSSQSASSSL